MPDVLIYADTVRSPSMRHEVPILVPDSFLYAERDGARHTVSTSFEVDRIAAIPGGPQAHPSEEYGFDDLIAQGLPREEVDLEVVVNACRALGDRETFAARRRVKNEAELAGIRRAQRAAEAGMDAARDLLRRAEPNGSGLLVDGEPLTAERLKDAINGAFVAHRVVAEDFIVAPGAQGAVGHDLGSGPIAAGQSVVIDLWPKDPETACYADMTRTYVVGEPPEELAEYHRLVKAALDRALETTRAGVPAMEPFRAVCDLFQEAGYPTQLSKGPGEVLTSGFFHGLGHGVGLEVHEPPWLGRAPGDMVAGDVVTLEPGLYRQGFGGVRLEDLVLVTESGAENLTEYPYELRP